MTQEARPCHHEHWRRNSAEAAPVAVYGLASPRPAVERCESSQDGPYSFTASRYVRGCVASSKGAHVCQEKWRQAAKSKAGSASPRGYYFLTGASRSMPASEGKSHHTQLATHSCLRLVDAGVPAPDIADLMGHEYIAATQRYWGTVVSVIGQPWR